MKLFFLLLVVAIHSAPAHAFEVLNLNVFDQLQGEWTADFRAQRLGAVAEYVRQAPPDLLVFQEAKGALPGKQKGGHDSSDTASLHDLYPHRAYVHEMTGADGASYGYWIGSRTAPKRFFQDGFSFPGGVPRRVQGVIFPSVGGRGCLGVVSLHLSYQTSAVRQVEARWLLDWIKARQKECGRWLVLGDFNADKDDAEMKILFDGGLQSLYRELKPTVGAFNPIRRIYGERTPSRTIDWALGWNLEGDAEVVLDTPFNGHWVSDHAAVSVKLK